MLFMPKLFFILIIFFFCAYAEGINFKESRYSTAEKNTTLKEGFLKINENNTTLQYAGSKTFYLGTKEYISIDNEKYSHEQQIELALFFLVINSIYKNDIKLLNGYFSILDNDKTIILMPNEYISHAIDKIIYNKNGTNLGSLHISFKNSDFIRIEFTR